MHFNTTVRLATDDAGATPVRGVRVSLFDKDMVTRDDLLASGVTDENGEAEFSFVTHDFMDVDDLVGGEFPELFAVITDAADRTLFTTRMMAVDNSVARYLNIRVPAEVVAQLRRE